jgi:hypothetical protein
LGLGGLFASSMKRNQELLVLKANFAVKKRNWSKRKNLLLKNLLRPTGAS